MPGLRGSGRGLGVDLFGYQTEDGRSIRRAVDFLVPYITGERKWPHKQIKEPNWGTFAQLLRRSATGFEDPRYDAMIEKVPGGGWGSEVWYNLLEPAMETTR